MGLAQTIPLDTPENSQFGMGKNLLKRWIYSHPPAPLPIFKSLGSPPPPLELRLNNLVLPKVDLKRVTIFSFKSGSSASKLIWPLPVPEKETVFPQPYEKQVMSNCIQQYKNCTQPIVQHLQKNKLEQFSSFKSMNTGMGTNN